MAKQLNVPAKFYGYVDNNSPELRELYETASIFVFTSESENFPIVLLEAMAAGAAIITTSGTGCAEVVGDAAILVPPRDPEAIRAALEQLESRSGAGGEARARRTRASRGALRLGARDRITSAGLRALRRGDCREQPTVSGVARRLAAIAAQEALRFTHDVLRRGPDS